MTVISYAHWRKTGGPKRSAEPKPLPPLEQILEQATQLAERSAKLAAETGDKALSGQHLAQLEQLRQEIDEVRGQLDERISDAANSTEAMVQGLSKHFSGSIEFLREYAKQIEFAAGGATTAATNAGTAAELASARSRSALTTAQSAISRIDPLVAQIDSGHKLLLGLRKELGAIPKIGVYVKDLALDRNDLVVQYSDGTEKRIAISRKGGSNVWTNSGGAAGDLPLKAVSVTSGYSVQNYNGPLLLLVDATAGPITIQLLPLSQAHEITIKRINTNANAVTVMAAAGETVDGVGDIDITTGRLGAMSAYELTPTTSGWWIT